MDIVKETKNGQKTESCMELVIGFGCFCGLGRDGLTHNMLELVHSHWKRREVCKIKCKGVPTVDMNNVCHHIEVCIFRNQF